MKTFQQFREGMLDDIIAEIEARPKVTDKEIQALLKKTDKHLKKKSPKSKFHRYRPRKYKGVKPDDFAKYIRSEAELKALLGGKITLRGIIDLFALHNHKLADNFTPMISVKELWYIREYDRKMVDGYTGKNTKEEMDALLASIKREGIKEHGYVKIDRRRNGDVEALLGEGNHRLSLAKKAGITHMPIMFSYGGYA